LLSTRANKLVVVLKSYIVLLINLVHKYLLLVEI